MTMTSARVSGRETVWVRGSVSGICLVAMMRWVRLHSNGEAGIEENDSSMRVTSRT